MGCSICLAWNRKAEDISGEHLEGPSANGAVASVREGGGLSRLESPGCRRQPSVCVCVRVCVRLLYTNCS
jgi:hypothetical protein